MVKAMFKGAVLAGAAMVATSQASAADFLFKLTTSDSTHQSIDSNTRMFSATNGTTTIKARVTGWSATRDSNGNITGISAATLNRYSEGLGVSSTDDGSGNFHTIDNKTRLDFVVFQFDQVVEVDKATLTPFKLQWTKDGKTYSSTDSDASIAIGNGGPGIGSDISAASIYNLLLPADYNILGGSSAYTPDINPGDLTGNLLLVGASFLQQTDSYSYTYYTSGPKKGQIKSKTYTGTDYDGFKLKNLTVSVVPEPATWAMMIAGFGMIGFAMRRRSRLDVVTA
jgi:hypothetical protein